ncbi:hypothetical protein E5161_02245 [Cohnella pontilimi]|uniref:Methyltransferase n=1 Tax=Cohnella pontilimi TaxID=2564100 RepID=A0A4U0FH13_9BACL|nr:hypothetical protein [Cohnella pontilimi]TJY44231.1 hypothetical protein E5161_02245 [Cohnella pontilimi]
MSRSWERKVERNVKTVNKRRKKEGKTSLSAQTQKGDRFLGRNYIFPILLVLLMAFYVVTFSPWKVKAQSTTMFWVTLGCYLLLALFYFLRRPYLSVTRDTLETRRFSGYKRLNAGEIRKIVLQPGYVVIETVKGANWVFSRVINRYPVDRMGERLKAFAELHHVQLEVKTK